jgi:Protein of unknown function (DUF2817)
MKEDASEYFSTSYSEARRLFLEAAEASSAAITSYKHPLLGVQGEELFVDVATAGSRDAPSALVLMSGTHGIEGYCGSAIQTGYLRSRAIEKTPHIKIVLVHALNPFGFSHVRRVNEENIDLNRNFVDFNNPPHNESYAKLAKLLHRKPTPLTRAVLIAYIVRYGFRTIQDGVTRGQYGYPEGLFFGGHAPSWSHVTWSTILAKHLHDTQDAVFIDYHTGLGKYGVGQILCSADPHSESGKIARREAFEIFGDKVKFVQVGNAKLATKVGNPEAVATPPSGDILNFTIESKKDSRFSGVFLEFGTLGRFAVLEALMAENRMVQLPNPDDTLRAKARLRRAFCPDDRRWQSAVWAQAREVTLRAAAALNARAS